MRADDFHFWPDVAVTQQRHAEPSKDTRHDASGAGTFEHGFKKRAVVLPDVQRPMAVEAVVIEGKERYRTISRKGRSRQNSMLSGTSRQPLQRSGRGTSWPSNRVVSRVIAASSAARSSSGRDWSEAQAPIRLSRARLAK